MKNKRAIFLNFMLVMGSLAIFFVLLEIFLALFAPHKITAKPFFHIQSFFCQYHPILGWANKPDYRDVVTVSGEHAFVVTHNSKGLRDRERPYAKPAGKKRICVLGDSFVWGFGVEDHEVFTRLIEEKVRGVEVINLGVSGYATDQELLAFSEDGYKYAPDLVVLAFYANDLDELAASISYGYPKPFVVPDSGPLTFANVPAPKTDETERKLYGNPPTMFGKAKKFLRRNTHTYPFIVGRLNSVPWLREFFLRTEFGMDYGRSLKDIPFYRMNETERDAVLSRLIVEIKTKAAEKGSDFLLVNIPIKENPPDGSYSYKGSSSIEKTANEEIGGKMASICLRNGVKFLDLAPSMREAQRGGVMLYRDNESDIHLNREGHSFVAEAIAAWLREYWR